MDKLDLISRNATGDQFLSDVVVDIERAVTFRSGKVTKQKLGRLLIRRFAPYPVDLTNTGVDLAAVLIGE